MVYNKSTLYLLLLLTVISAIIIGVIIGCDEKTIDAPILGPAAGSGPIGGGETQKIRLSASPSDIIIAVGDEQASAKITALVENNIGQPMPDGTAVYWTATVGSLDSTTQTTSNGSATVTLTFQKSYSGCSTVTAKSGDSQASIAICTTHVTPTPTVTATTTATSTPTPSEGFVVRVLDDDGIIDNGQEVKVTATVSTNGKPDVGIQVNFSVSGAGILTTSAAITDKSGVATVILRGNNTSGSDQQATVTASTADGRSGSVTVVVKSGDEPTATPTATATAPPTATPSKTFIVTTDIPTINVTLGETATITAFAATNGIADNGLQVNFSTTSGLLSASAAVTVAGNAQVVFTGVNPGPGNITATITATTLDGRSGSIAVIVTP